MSRARTCPDSAMAPVREAGGGAGCRRPAPGCRTTAGAPHLRLDLPADRRRLIVHDVTEGITVAESDQPVPRRRLAAGLDGGGDGEGRGCRLSCPHRLRPPAGSPSASSVSAVWASYQSRSASGGGDTSTASSATERSCWATSSSTSASWYEMASSPNGPDGSRWARVPCTGPARRPRPTHLSNPARSATRGSRLRSSTRTYSPPRPSRPRPAPTTPPPRPPARPPRRARATRRRPGRRGGQLGLELIPKCGISLGGASVAPTWPSAARARWPPGRPRCRASERARRPAVRRPRPPRSRARRWGRRTEHAFGGHRLRCQIADLEGRSRMGLQRRCHPLELIADVAILLERRLRRWWSLLVSTTRLMSVVLSKSAKASRNRSPRDSSRQAVPAEAGAHQTRACRRRPPDAPSDCDDPDSTAGCRPSG